MQEHLQQVFQQSEHGLGHTGPFQELNHSLIIPPTIRRRELEDLRRVCRSLGYQLWALATSALKLEWLHTQTRDGALSPLAWMQFATTDTEYFFITFRSALDHIAALVAGGASKPNQVPTDSFRKLLKYVGDGKCQQRSRALLGNDLVELVGETEGWFWDARAVRDAAVHRHNAEHTLVFSPNDGILVQVYKQGFYMMLHDPRVMHNKNVVDFRRYAGLHFAYLITLLDRVSVAVAKRINGLNADPTCAKPTSYHGGFAVLMDWYGTLDGEL